MRNPATHRRRGLNQALTAIGALLAAALLLTLGLTKFTFPHHGGVAGSGATAEQTRSLPPFSGVVLEGDNNVVVRIGPGQSVVVHAERALLRRITTRVRSGALVIGTTPGDLDAHRPMMVVVTVPKLDRIALEGNGNITVSGVLSPSLRVELPGNGNIEASGTAEKLDVAIAGNGTALLRGLIARDATAELSGDGTIMLTVSRSLAARLSGTGTILYGGSPLRVSQRVTGTGTISAG